MDNNLERAVCAEEALVRRDELYAVVIHDLRNPLNTISMSCALLGGDLQGAAKETLARIKRAVDRMEKIMRDVSELTRFEHGGVQLDLTSIAIADFVRHAFEPFLTRAAERHVTLAVADVDPSLRVVIDRERLMRALAAMIDNAVRLVPEGGRVELGVRPGGDFVDLVVRDDGPGLAAHDQETVFDRHRHINKKRGQGLALGLAVARMIAALHGGSIGVDSELGKGATFWIRLKIDSATSADKASL